MVPKDPLGGLRLPRSPQNIRAKPKISSDAHNATSMTSINGANIAKNSSRRSASEAKSCHESLGHTYHVARQA